MPALKRIGAAALSAFGFGQGSAATVTANYLIVAGGAAGGSSGAGFGTSAGGGAGGYQASTATLNTTLSYTVIVGAGGATAAYDTVGTNGSNSSITNLTASVGGGGGGAGSNKSGNSGGSSGGSVQGFTPSAATSGQGNIGGTGSGSGANYGCGGGGGASAVGANGTSSAGGNGGSGTASSISGSSVTYSGGGGGGTYNGGTPGTGGSGGGGNGNTSGGVGYNGTANTGGGGGGTGGTSGSSNAYGGQGGSGIVIISYTGAQQFGGGVVTTAAGNTIHTFYTSGTLSPINSLSASYLIVAGGAGGGSRIGGGGGAGGLLSGSALTIDTNSTYVVTVGAGGSAATSTPGTIGGNGSNSAFSIYSTVAVGGGGGGAYIGTTGTVGSNGGSGGGGSVLPTSAGGTGVSGQGFAGGSGGGTYAGGGGGGAGAVGTAGSGGSSVGGSGGIGVQSSITGTATYYAGGGGGSGDSSGGPGGSGGGGAGGIAQNNATSGTANTGGGGGGARNGTDTTNVTSGAGGSGVVIISYAGSTQQMQGGSITITGGNVIHTFTTSGYLTPITNFNNSLRFRSSASAYLSRTPTVAGNRKTWTWSGWVKRGAFNAGIFQGFSGGNITSFAFGGTGNVTLFVQDYTSGSYNLIWETTAVFRDPASWYHLVCAYDTTQASSANAVKVYVNGVQQTLTFTAASGSYSQNRDSYVNATNAQNIGTYSGVANYQDGYMTNINFIDGQALAPTAFGGFNSYGTWSPVTYGGSYGTNGFFLPFTYSNTTSISASYLIVAGGGGAGTNGGGGGGAGGLLANTTTLTLGKSYTVAVGAGGAGSATPTAGLQGGSSNITASGFTTLTTTGGGNGGVGNGGDLEWLNGKNGGSGGGAHRTNTAGAGISGQGFAGAQGISTGGSNAGGGGGAGSAGSVSTGTDTGGNGGTGYQSSISGTATYYASGGGGGGNTAGGTASSGGGGNGGAASVNGTAGSANTGGGAGGSGANATGTQNGGSGVVILSYAGSTQWFTGGTVTQAAGNTIHTFTTSGTLATNTAVLGYDYSPQGNNWTPNNFSLTTGSTFDSMVDVPTLTSANVANYAVLNPLSTTAGTFSAANLQFVGPSGWRTALSTISIPTTGKWYAEATVIGTVYTPRGPTTGNNAFGVVPTATFDSTLSPNINALGLFIIDSGYYNNFATSATDTGSAVVNGDVLAIAVDTGANTFTLYKNNTSVASGTINVTAGTPLSFAITSYYGSYSPLAVNFGQQPFAYTPPSGYLPLNTFNM